MRTVAEEPSFIEGMAAGPDSFEARLARDLLKNLGAEPCAPAQDGAQAPQRPE